MSNISDITQPEAVKQAMAEYDRIGRDMFLHKYGYGTATKYVLKENAKLYDSKAILGVAYGFQFPEEGPLASADFSGGEMTVARVLKSLGFEVVELPRGGEDKVDTAKSGKNPNWTRDELILALDLYFRVNPLTTSESNPEIVALSELLNKLPIHTDRPDAEHFRNPNGVYMKLCNLLRFDPGYKGVGLKAGGKLEETIWNEFANDKPRLKTVAEAIRAAADVPKKLWEEATDDSDLDEAAEGKVLTRLHKVRERNRELVQRKKKKVAEQTGCLACDVCSFDFGRRYGDLGEGFIECHHTLPLSVSSPGERTRLTDLALVCANCHRMLHRGPKWLSVVELRAVLDLVEGATDPARPVISDLT